MASMKLERLMNLLAALLHTKVPLSARTIRERVGGYGESDVAFHRQFSRDKEDLRELGVPLLVEFVPDANEPVEGYRIDPKEYYLPDPGMEPEELAALHLATRMIAVSSDRSPHGLFKLGGVTGTSEVPGPPRAEVPTIPGLGLLFEAIGTGHTVSFAYRGLQRHLVPRKLGFQHGNWYVSGWDTDADDDRLYRVDRIEGEISRIDGPTLDISERVPGIGPLEPWTIGGAEPFTARVRIDAANRPAFLARFGEDRIIEEGVAGSAVFGIDVVSSEGFITWLLGFPNGVEILGPQELRAEMIARLERALEGIS